jgi:hypothetical protein
MHSETIIRTAGFELAVAISAFEIQELLGRLAFRLVRLTAHRQPQQV